MVMDMYICVSLLSPWFTAASDTVQHQIFTSTLLSQKIAKKTRKFSACKNLAFLES